MDPTAFRRDAWLRTSGYHLVTWSLLAFVLELRSLSPDVGSTSLVVALVGGAVLTSLTHERRVGKMAGAAGDPVWPLASALWACTLALLFAASVAASTMSHGSWVFPLWMTGAGAAFVVWGLGAWFVWFAAVGAAMLAVAVADVAMLVTKGSAWEPLRLVMLGAGLPVLGLVTNWRYLWFRAPRED